MKKQGYAIRDDNYVYAVSLDRAEIFNEYCRVLKKEYPSIKHIVNDNKGIWRIDFEKHMDEKFLSWNAHIFDKIGQEELFRAANALEITIDRVKVI